MIKYLCIGDSHISLFSGIDDTHIEVGKIFTFDIFKVMNVGPYLAYNLLQQKKIDKIKNTYDVLNIEKESCNNIIFSFGEIDMLYHVSKQSKIQNKSEEKIIDKIVENYFSFLKLFKDKNIFLLESHKNKYFNYKLENSKFNIIKKYDFIQNSNGEIFADDIHLNPSKCLSDIRKCNEEYL